MTHPWHIRTVKLLKANLKSHLSKARSVLNIRASPPLVTCLPMLATRYIRLVAARQLRIVNTSLLFPWKQYLFTFIHKNDIYQEKGKGSSQNNCLARVVGKDENILDQGTQNQWGRPRGTQWCLLRLTRPRWRNTRTEQDCSSSLTRLLPENTVSVPSQMTLENLSVFCVTCWHFDGGITSISTTEALKDVGVMILSSLCSLSRIIA